MSFPLMVIFFIIAEIRKNRIQNAAKKENPTALRSRVYDDMTLQFVTVSVASKDLPMTGYG